jgi:Flp pilus assembly protein TadB
MTTRWLRNPWGHLVMHLIFLIFGLLTALNGERLGVFMVVLAAISLLFDVVQLRRRRALQRESLQDVDFTS